MAKFALGVTRLGFTALQAISPRLAGEAAFRLFCRTPPQRPQGAKAKAAHAAGMDWLKNAERIELPLASGKRAAAFRINGGALGKRKRYLVTHGWGSGMAYMTDLIAHLAKDGAEVIGLDFPGHGLSGGRFLHMGLAVEAIAAAQERFGAFDAAVGHSFGGAALMVSATGILPHMRPIEVEKIVTIGSPSEMAWLFTDFGRMIGIGKAAQAALEGKVGRITGRQLADFDVAKPAGRLTAQVLTIHAEDDKEVGAHHARRYQAAGEAVRVFWANGFGHRRIIGAKPVLDEIEAFLGDRQGQGAEIVSFVELPVRRASL
jgi:pimeloyl-ACP methyl ester carboxylesterase